MANGRGKVTTHPPAAKVEAGGPPETRLATGLRDKREKVGADLNAARAARRNARPEEREKHDQKIGELSAEVRKLSDHIRAEEAPK